jgi:hypothetical protein
LFLHILVKNSFVLLAKGAYVPEAGYASLDMSMPSYNVEESDALVKTKNNDIISNSDGTGSNKKKVASSSPSRAEKGALAVAQAKAKKEAAKAEALSKQQELKAKSFATAN